MFISVCIPFYVHLLLYFLCYCFKGPLLIRKIVVKLKLRGNVSEGLKVVGGVCEKET